MQHILAYTVDMKTEHIPQGELSTISERDQLIEYRDLRLL